MIKTTVMTRTLDDNTFFVMAKKPSLLREL